MSSAKLRHFLIAKGTYPNEVDRKTSKALKHENSNDVLSPKQTAENPAAIATNMKTLCNIESSGAYRDRVIISKAAPSLYFSTVVTVPSSEPQSNIDYTKMQPAGTIDQP